MISRFSEAPFFFQRIKQKLTEEDHQCNLWHPHVQAWTWMYVYTLRNRFMHKNGFCGCCFLGGLPPSALGAIIKQKLSARLEFSMEPWGRLLELSGCWGASAPHTHRTRFSSCVTSTSSSLSRAARIPSSTSAFHLGPVAVTDYWAQMSSPPLTSDVSFCCTEPQKGLCI